VQTVTAGCVPFQERCWICPKLGLKGKFHWKLRTPERARSASLQMMQQDNPLQPQSPERSSDGSSGSGESSQFAGLLARLTTPQPGSTNGSALWDEGDLGEDIATLSYESALRAHARYNWRDSGDSRMTRDTELQAGSGQRVTGGARIDPAGSAGVRFHGKDGETAEAGHDGDLKRASVTVRFSRGEAEQLRRRSAEAGLTVSAYLRSCAFEIEGLRAQVKDALATMRSNGSTAKPAVRIVRKRAGSGWRARFRWLTRLVEHGSRARSSRPIIPLATRGI